MGGSYILYEQICNNWGRSISQKPAIVHNHSIQLDSFVWLIGFFSVKSYTCMVRFCFVIYLFVNAGNIGLVLIFISEIGSSLTSR